MIAEAREEIVALDERLVETINARVRAVGELRRFKAENGLPFVDAEREAWLIAHLKEVNDGPLSERGVEELVTFVLDLVKREVARG